MDSIAEVRLEMNRLGPTFSGNPAVYIYALIDPRTDDIRYIGKSIRPVERLWNHMKDRSNCHRSHWLSELRREGLRPDIILLERIDGAWPWQYSEKYWIAYGRANGWPLTNNTSGGDGVEGLPAAAREKMASTWRGRKHHPESIEKMRAANAGRKHTDEWRKLMRDKMSGRKITWIDKVSAALVKFTPNQVASIRERIANGEKVKDIAAEFGAHRTTISKIKLGRYP